MSINLQKLNAMVEKQSVLAAGNSPKNGQTVAVETTTASNGETTTKLVMTNSGKETIRTSLAGLSANGFVIKMPEGNKRVVFKNFGPAPVEASASTALDAKQILTSTAVTCALNANGVPASKPNEIIDVLDLTDDNDTPNDDDIVAANSDQKFDAKNDLQPTATTSTEIKQEIKQEIKHELEGSSNDRKRKHSEIIESEDQKRVCPQNDKEKKKIQNINELKQYVSTIANVKMNSCCDCKAKLKEVQERNTAVIHKNAQFLKVVLHLKQQIDVLKGKVTKDVVSVGTQCTTLGAQDPQVTANRVQSLPTSPNGRFSAVQTSRDGTGQNVNSPIHLQQSQARRVQVVGMQKQSPMVQTKSSPPKSQPMQLVMVPANNASAGVQQNRQIRPTAFPAGVLRYAMPVTVGNHATHLSGTANQAIFMSNGHQPGVVSNMNSQVRMAQMSQMPPLTRAPNSTNVANRQDHNLTMSTPHPLPLPIAPLTSKQVPAAIGLPPPEPTMSCQKSTDPNNVGVQLSWDHSISHVYTKIKHYHLFAYQENPNATWKQVGTIEPLELPMACTLTAFAAGERYHFAIRAVDIYDRIGPFSAACSLKT